MMIAVFPLLDQSQKTLSLVGWPIIMCYPCSEESVSCIVVHMHVCHAQMCNSIQHYDISPFQAAIDVK